MKKGRRQDNGRYGQIYGNILTKEFLVEEYCNKKRSPYKIAAKIGCSVKIVYNYLENFGIDRVVKLAVEKDDEFGLLIALEIVGKSKNGTYIWKCKCSCGNFTEVPSTRLKGGRCKSCGCLKNGAKSYRWKGYCDITGTMVDDIKQRAKKHNREFNIDAKFLWELFLKQDKKCALSGCELILNNNASLDRIDSSKGYTEDNVQWVTRKINFMKSNLNQQEFISICTSISNRNKISV